MPGKDGTVQMNTNSNIHTLKVDFWSLRKMLNTDSSVKFVLDFQTFLNPNWANHRSSLGKVNLYHPEYVWSNSTDTTKHILLN